jgi:carboxyl-terminal processing protease
MRVFKIVIVLLIVFMAGLYAGAQHIGSRLMPGSLSASIYATAPDGVDLDPVWKVWYTLDDRFVDPYYEENAENGDTQELTEEEKNQKRVWGLAAGLAASTDDPYTVFMPPSDAEIFADDISGEFEGVGMEIGIRDGVLTVVSPLRGTPAYDAGIKAQDRILKIDGKSTKGLSVTNAVKKIRGPKGTPVVFEILREGEGILEIEVIRGVIEIPTIETRQLSTGEFVIELLHFSANSSELFRNALMEFQNSGSNKLILDLRGNPGGYLGAAVNMASWFLPKGDIVVTEDYGPGGKKIEHRSAGMNVFNDNLDMVILVDKGSASASEILAGALRESGKAKLIGTNTFGKGSVQELVDITDDTSLKVTVARWLLPGGIHINKDGIEPDISVNLEQILEDSGKSKFDEGEDPILDRALEYYRTGK